MLIRQKSWVIIKDNRAIKWNRFYKIDAHQEWKDTSWFKIEWVEVIDSFIIFKEIIEKPSGKTCGSLDAV